MKAADPAIEGKMRTETSAAHVKGLLAPMLNPCGDKGAQGEKSSYVDSCLSFGEEMLLARLFF